MTMWRRMGESFPKKALPLVTHPRVTTPLADDG
jgi:hypothetical protein